MDTTEQAWVCTVCGYVHRGPAPPEVCPVCGAGRDAFEAQVPPPGASSRPRQWRCLICGYVHDGPEPPAECAVCGASKDEFEGVAEPSAKVAAGSPPAKVVIVGAGIAGLSAAESARQASPQSEIVLVHNEPDLPYYRLNLTRLLAGEIAEDALPLHASEWYERNRISLVRGAAARIAPDGKYLELAGGDRIPYDKLILTCGSHPFIPPIRGADTEGVSAFRTLTDARSLLDAAGRGEAFVCIGGGILGLETAGGLARRGASVTLLEGHEWLLPRQLNRRAGEILEKYVTAAGIKLRRSAAVEEIVGDARVRGVRLRDGAVLPADRVTITTGVRPNTHLARSAGLSVNQGIVVDSHLTTSHPDILAAGDVAECCGALYGLWEPARYQGSLAGMNAGGVRSEFGGIPRATALKVLCVDLFSVGTFTPADGADLAISQESDGRYYHFVFRDNRLVGGILLGDTRAAAQATKAIKGNLDMSEPLSRRPSAIEVADYLLGRT